LNSGKLIGFTSPNAIQYRNEHNLLDDFSQESLLYTKACEIAAKVQSVASTELSYSDNLWNAYTGLLEEGHVKAQELDALDAWLTACKAVYS
jgi:hypothetical protein